MSLIDGMYFELLDEAEKQKPMTRPSVETPTRDALKLVLNERIRQRAKWGDNSGGQPFEWMSILGEEYGELCEAINETYFQNPKHPKRGGYEAIVREAVHVAAVAVAIIETFRPTGKEETK